MNSNDIIRITTPAGTAVFPKLNQPDTKFNEDGVYTLPIRFNLSDTTSTFQVDGKTHQGGVPAFIAFVEDHVAKLDAGSKNGVKNPFFKQATDEHGNETGEVLARFDMKAIVRPKGKESWTQKPKAFDGGGKPLQLEGEHAVKVGSGSTVKASAQLVPYDTAQAGVGFTRRLQAAQIIHLVEGGGTAESYGFEVVEDGFTAAEATPEAAADGFDF